MIFICTFDLFGKNRCIYVFENLCVDDSNVRLKDGTHKIFLNTKGDKDGIDKELKALLDYFDGKEPDSKLTRQIDKKVAEARDNEKWRREYMSWQMEMNQKYRDGLEKGHQEINQLTKILLSEKRYEDLEKASSDSEYQKQLMKKYNIIK